MNPILKMFEDLLYYRLMSDKELGEDELIEMLEIWYELRRQIEGVEDADRDKLWVCGSLSGGTASSPAEAAPMRTRRFGDDLEE